jgi:predicted nuclease of restriction endonuclease-like (RecB) superfamily
MGVKSDKNYALVLRNLKEKIRVARLKASFTVNTQLLQLYWEIGSTILQRQKQEGWGTKVIGRLASDLRSEFPDMKGLSQRNFVYMQTFAAAYPHFPFFQPRLTVMSNNSITQPLVAQLKKDKERQSVLQKGLSKLPSDVITQPLVAQLPWTHHTIILDKLQTWDERIFYVCKAIQNGWSKSVLTWQIESKLHLRQGKAITNFEQTLPKDQSGLANEMLKNPYSFDLMGISEEMQERELEKALIHHIKKFLLELGRGFAYVGNQFNIVIEKDDYFLDLLFYNYHLHCFVVFELKVGKFTPEYAGKLNFYINTVDAQIKGKADRPTMGVLLCKTPNRTVVKYALQGMATPMGVADYEFAKALPKNLKSGLPTIEELENTLAIGAKKFARPVAKKMKRAPYKQKIKAKARRKNRRAIK